MREVTDDALPKPQARGVFMQALCSVLTSLLTPTAPGLWQIDRAVMLDLSGATPVAAEVFLFCWVFFFQSIDPPVG